MPDGGADLAIATAEFAPPPASGLVPAVAAIARERLSPIADQIDRQGFYPIDLLARFGAAGAFAAHLSAHAGPGGRSLRAAIEAMAAIGTECMSTAFCTWCQDAAGWYLEHTDNAALRVRLQPGIAAGETMGATGLSNPVKALAGIEDFALRGRRVPGGYQVSGVLPWVSNLGDGHWFGTVFQIEDDPAHRVMAMVCCGRDGVEIRRGAHFVALEGTGTYAVRFRRAFVADEALLADPLGDMPRRIRPGFTLLQTGMGFGVIDASIAAMRRADATHRHTNRFLPRGRGRVRGRDERSAAARAAASGPGCGGADARSAGGPPCGERTDVGGDPGGRTACRCARIP